MRVVTGLFYGGTIDKILIDHYQSCTITDTIILGC